MGNSRLASRVALLAAHPGTEADGIWDYTRRLHATLRDEELDATVFEWTDGAPRGENGSGYVKTTASELEAMDVLILQYEPFSFGRRGFAPGLALFLARLRRRRPRPLIAVMFHETYVRMKNLRWALMGSWQRAQLLAIQAAADVQFCSIQRWSERLRKTSLGRPVHHLPVASNLPDARAHRSRVRRSLAADPNTIVLSCMGLRHPGRLQQEVLASARAAGTVSRSVLLLDLGPGAPSTTPLDENVEMRATGYLPAEDLAGHIAASDVFLAPYMDGVSTRRTSVMAALQHGVPVVGTTGPLTDDALTRARELLLVPPEHLVAAVTYLVGEPESRAELGAAGRRLYGSAFDWPVLVQRLRDHLDV
jgi:glycosyltransferase involved in cell wall biosynthesis